MWHDGSEKNKISCSFTVFWQILAEDQEIKIKIKMSFFTDILLPEQVKKLVHSVHQSAPFYLT